MLTQGHHATQLCTLLVAIMLHLQADALHLHLHAAACKSAATTYSQSVSQSGILQSSGPASPSD